MANITTIDPANELVHVKIDTNIPGLELSDGDITISSPSSGSSWVKVHDVEDNTFYLSGTTNNDNEERLSQISFSSDVLAKHIKTPTIQVKQHRKPDTYQLGLCQIRLKVEPFEVATSAVTLEAKGGSVIVSACAWKNGVTGVPCADLEVYEDFNISTADTFIKLGKKYPEDDRVEWICKVDRNDTFSDKKGTITVSFDGGGSNTVHVTVKAKEHTVTEPVLYIDTVSIGNGSTTFDFESYYTLDGFKKPIAELICDKTGISYTYNSQTYKGKITIPSNYVDEDTGTEQVAYTFYTRTQDGAVSPQRTVYQDGYVPVEHTYTFDAKPYYLPSKSLTMKNGVKTWINHVPSSGGTFYINITSSRDGQYFYEDGRNPDYVNSGIRITSGGDTSNVSHGWVNPGEGNTGLYYITLPANNTNVTKTISFTFAQKELKGSQSLELGKYTYEITQMDQNSIMVYGHDSNGRTEPNYVLVTMGSDLLTGSGFTASASVKSGSTTVAKVGTNANELGDSSTMNLCWGGQNTNYYGNQYIAFSPKNYIGSSKSDITFTVYGQTKPNGDSSNGIITMNIEAMTAKPTLSRSYVTGIKNIIYPSGSPTFKGAYHARLNADNKTTLFTAVRYYVDDSLWIRRVGSTIPQYSNNTNYDGLNNPFYSSVWAATRLAETSIVEPINACVIKDSTQYHAKITHKTHEADGFYEQKIYTNATGGVFDKIELYYDMTRYRIIRVLVDEYYDTSQEHPFSAFSLRSYNIGESSNTLTFIFDKVDELNEYETGTIDRNVYISMNSETNWEPMSEMTGVISDLTTKMSTTFTISQGDFEGDRRSRKISWQDISNGSKDPNRLLKIVTIDGLEDGRMYDGTIYEFLGLKNAPSTGIPTHDSFSPFDTFRYGFNSSTPRLVLGFNYAGDTYNSRTLYLLGLQLDRILKCLGFSQGNQYYFTEGSWEMNVYKWNRPSGYYGAPKLYDMFLHPDQPAFSQLTEAEYSKEPTNFSLGSLAATNSSTATPCGISEKDIDSTTDVIIRLRMYDPTHDNVKRFDGAWCYKYQDLVGTTDNRLATANTSHYLVLAGKYIYNNYYDVPSWTYEFRTSSGTNDSNKYATNMFSDNSTNSVKALILTQSFSNLQDYFDMEHMY